jgi:subtilisin family serine protease
MNAVARLIAIAAMTLAPALTAHAAPRPMRIAVIDSGVVRTAALAGTIEGEYDMVDARAPYSAISDHGTAVSTVIATASHRPVRIVSLRVDAVGACDEHECGMEAYAIVSAIYKAMELKVDVINLSIDIDYERIIYNAMQRASRAGIRIIMAAGNKGGVPRSLLYARGIPKRMWLVGAIDDQGRPADFSARPEEACDCQFVWRPGVDVETQNRIGQRVYGSGTSFAAPIMTAEIADDMAARRH